MSSKLTPWKQYRRTNVAEMRPYIPGEDLSTISVNPVDTPGPGGMIARNPKNHEDQWYVAEQYFKDNFAEHDAAPGGWRPIETAPTDGTVILLATPRGRIADGMYDVRYGVWAWPYVMATPTHWLPAPPPPEDRK